VQFFRFACILFSFNLKERDQMTEVQREIAGYLERNFTAGDLAERLVTETPPAFVEMLAGEMRSWQAEQSSE
jgi:hypothetical protein